jgi:hypothetical protein
MKTRSRRQHQFKQHLVINLRVVSEEEMMFTPKLHYLQRSFLQSNSRALKICSWCLHRLQDLQDPQQRHIRGMIKDNILLVVCLIPDIRMAKEFQTGQMHHMMLR